ncbi:hypothetical protein ABZY03_08015 [Streptomyces klenkii]|uniref:hypothetical protein n=1 Tax=Streptomyces klenkii TaxID=1420899 RepID=UPI0033AA91C3
MTEASAGPAEAGRAHLTPPQAARLAMDRLDLARARSADLAAMEQAEMVVLVERLRGALYDALRLVEELAGPTIP